MSLNQIENEKKQTVDLADIALKLEQVSHKLGRPVSGNVPVPLESDELNSDFPSIQLIRKDQTDSLSRLPVALQEFCIIEDLLFLVLVKVIILQINSNFSRILMENIFLIIKIQIHQTFDMLFLLMKVLNQVSLTELNQC